MRVARELFLIHLDFSSMICGAGSAMRQVE
jgi:hypothetical protein